MAVSPSLPLLLLLILLLLLLLPTLNIGQTLNSIGSINFCLKIVNLQFFYNEKKKEKTKISNLNYFLLHYFLKYLKFIIFNKKLKNIYILYIFKNISFVRKYILKKLTHQKKKLIYDFHFTGVEIILSNFM